MKKCLFFTPINISSLLIVALMIFAPSAICLAAPVNPGAYVSGFIGVHVPENTDVPSTDFFTNNSYNDRVEFDPGINVGVTGGYDFGIVRLEGELSYKNAEIKSITNLETGERFRNVDGNLGVLAMMFNGFMDLHNYSPLTPYLGGGIGFASLHLSDTFGTQVGGGTARPVLLYGSDDDFVFAYQVGAGVDIALNRRFSLDIGYRYFGTERANFDSDQDILTSMRYKSHTATIGFRSRF